MSRPSQAKRHLNEAAAIARQIVEDPGYVKTLKARACTGDLQPAMEALLWHYAYGRPAETLEINDVTQRVFDLGDDELNARIRTIMARLESRTASSVFDDEPHGTVQ